MKTSWKQKGEGSQLRFERWNDVDEGFVIVARNDDNQDTERVIIITPKQAADFARRLRAWAHERGEGTA